MAAPTGRRAAGSVPAARWDALRLLRPTPSPASLAAVTLQADTLLALNVPRTSSVVKIVTLE